MRLRNPASASSVLSLSRIKVEVPLIGPKDHSNLTFTTPQKFVLSTLAVYFNGQRLRRGTGEDYIADESGGPGMGYDTIILLDLNVAPYSEEQLIADYVSA